MVGVVKECNSSSNDFWSSWSSLQLLYWTKNFEIPQTNTLPKPLFVVDSTNRGLHSELVFLLKSLQFAVNSFNNFSSGVSKGSPIPFEIIRDMI